MVRRYLGVQPGLSSGAARRDSVAEVQAACTVVLPRPNLNNLAMSTPKFCVMLG